VDRRSRLSAPDWKRLKVELAAQQIRVVALDLPTSWTMSTSSADEFTGRMFGAINGMMIDMRAAVARKDDEDRRRREKQKRAKAEGGRYPDRKADVKRNAGIAAMLGAGSSWPHIQAATA